MLGEIQVDKDSSTNPEWHYHSPKPSFTLPHPSIELLTKACQFDLSILILFLYFYGHYPDSVSCYFLSVHLLQCPNRSTYFQSYSNQSIFSRDKRTISKN